ncbi:hypothetical protein [Amycolatopsis sp. Hca4]|uniref:hypothetical protein n=1 Tax=Amycolatopsis sp. Hca4 TaxID=2742131 RepID=UPI001C37BE9F|nr:hypothetical protein [Amycolatopsis sp. Hca4]
MVGAIWAHSVPSPSMLAAYELVPSLAEHRLDFPTMLTTLIIGNFGCPRPDASPPSTSGQSPAG